MWAKKYFRGCSMSLVRSLNLLIALLLFAFIATLGSFQWPSNNLQCECDKPQLFPNLSALTSNQEQESYSRCPEVDYEAVIRANNHELPVRKWTYEGENAICEGTDAKNCIPKRRVKHGQYFWVSKPARIVGCSIKKNMSQLMQAILCFLNDELKFLYSGKDLVRDVFKRGCSEERFGQLKEAIEHRHATKEAGWSYMAIVRDPVDRLLSGFLYMCISGEHTRKGCSYECHGCEKNMTCWIERQYKKISDMAENTKKRRDHPTEHSYPQNWRCDFATYLQHYDLLHYKIESDEFYPVLRSYLAQRNVSERALEYIRAKMTTLRTSHSTSMSKVRPFLEQRLRSSSYLMELVTRMYYHDFTTFKMELPDIPDT